MTKQEILNALNDAEIKEDVLFYVESRLGKLKTPVQGLLAQALAYSLKHFDGRYNNISNETANAVLAQLEREGK